MSRRFELPPNVCVALFAALVVCWTGCAASESKPDQAGNGGSGAGEQGDADPPGVKTPATGAEAAAALDLSDFPLAPGAGEPGRRCLARLSYRTTAPPPDAYAFCKAEFAKRKWRELPGSNESAESSNAVFSRSGFVVSLSASNYGGQERPTNVFIVNHGNVVLALLPVPEDSKELYNFPSSVAYVTTVDAPTAASAVDKLLADGGWAPYGSAGDSRFYKQNAIRLTATVSSAPAQNDKTVITYSAEQLSEDIPAPAEGLDVRYSEPPTQLSLRMTGNVAAADAWYRDALGKLGWEPTTDHPISDNNESWVIYRRKDEAMLQIHFRKADDATQLLVDYMTPKEFAEMERRFDEEKKKAEGARQAEQAGK